MNNSELSRWVNDYTEALFIRARQKTGNPEMAKDLVQETFLAAAEGHENFRSDSSPLTWLFAILNRKIMDYYRRRYKQPVSVDINTVALFFNQAGDWKKSERPAQWAEDENHLLDDEAFLAVLEACFELLPDKWSACMKLKYYMNKKGEAICQELGITPSNLWQIMHRAKLKLRDCIETNWTQNG